MGKILIKLGQAYPVITLMLIAIPTAKNFYLFLPPPYPPQPQQPLPPPIPPLPVGRLGICAHPVLSAAATFATPQTLYAYQE